ncbi:MAG: aspartate aminotransferase [Saprospiraceae bacterium]|jgi:aspartate aminotransferase
MPNVSRRGEQMIHSPIRSLMPFARQAKKEGVEVLHLNIGQPDIKTPRAALESLASYDQEIIKYGASEGNEDLRRTVSKYYTENVADIDYSEVYVTTGASEAILFILFSCFEAGQEIIIPEPFYANYIGFSQISGVVVRPVQSSIDDHFGLPEPSSFVEQITSQTKALFLCNPGNPTGNLYSKEDLIEIGKLVKEHDLFLIVDEVYREFCYDEEFYSVLKLEGLEDHVVVVDSISKVFSACGSRIGFVVTRSQSILDNILKYAQLRLCPPMIGQHVALACFDNRASYLTEVRAEYNRRRLYLHERLSQMKGVTCYLPKAAFYIMTALPVKNTSDFCKWLLSDFRLEGKTIMMAPGDGFYLSNHMGRDQVRIAFVLNVERLKVAMDILEAGLKEYKLR